MSEFDPSLLKKLYKPASSSHKGDNGKVLIIAGSKLFHAASLWPLMVASRIVDMVFYSSVEENNELVQDLKKEFRNGIIVPRARLEDYVEEADSILIGPGLPRPDGQEDGDDNTKELTERLFNKFPDKKWVVDGGSLQTIDPTLLPKMAIVTPHRKEFSKLFNYQFPITPTSPRLRGASNFQSNSNEVNDQIQKKVEEVSKKYGIVILLKGEVDIVVSPSESVMIPGGNPGMTKGGTGDVLAGLVASLYAKNDAFLSACAASYINKRAGEALAKRVGIYFNATDLAAEIPQEMARLDSPSPARRGKLL